ncbi:MAG TPA: TspO/MBR family protein [Pyrinomonadaceae bacterium]|nr:TspO/MBR family protein [Pyrinomonadaceae bacterium]
MNTQTYLPQGASQWIALACAVGVCFAAAVVGSLYTTPAIPTWYASLQKPAWNPPNWVFGPAWTLLYLMMAVAVWLVWRERGLTAGVALTLFAVQLILNAFWSVIFFGWRRPDLALVEIFFLWAAIFATMLAFWRISQFAAWLMWPYLLWVTFAGFLNLAIWKLNR